MQKLFWPSSLIPRPPPFLVIWFMFSILQATKSWAGPGNEASITEAGEQ